MSETDKARGVNLGLLDAFRDMLEVPRWLVWSWVKRGARWTKAPHIPGTAIAAKVNDARGVSYAEARAAVTAVSQPAAGVGWRVLDDIGRVWIDADKCRDPNTGAIAPWAAVLLAWAVRVGAYHEITPSGTGIRIMGRVEGVEGAAAVPFQTHMMMAPFLKELDEGALEDWGGSADCHPRAGIELYHACARYVTVTGHEGEGRSDADLTELVMPLVEMAREAGGGGGLREGRAAGRAPAGALRGPIEDVCAALEVMTNDASVSWDAWVKVGLAVVNASGADRWDEGLAAFDLWSMKCAEKYDAEATAAHWEHWIRSPADQLGIGYLMVLAKEAAGAGWRRPSRRPDAEFDVVDLPSGSPSGPAIPAGGKKAEPETEKQRAAFTVLAGRLTYLVGINRFHDDATHALLDDAGAHKEAASMLVHGAGTGGAKGLIMRLMRTAARPGGLVKAFGMVAAPGGGRHVEAVNEHGRRVLMLNTWVPAAPLDGEDGSVDPGPWVGHMRLLIPDAADRERVIDRMAWAVQHPGVKINSALVLLGAEKTGKDTCLEPLWAALGPHNMKIVGGRELGGDFNEYLLKPWVLVSEVPSHRRRSCYEEIKGWTAAPPNFLRINLKGLPAFTIPNIINTAMTTNHIDAMALTETDRRFDIIATAAAHGGDPGPYFDRLYDWYEKRGGLGAVARLLRTREVGARFSPKHEPPVSTAKAVMIREAEPAGAAWARSLLAAEGPLAGRTHVTLDEIMDMARRGAWGASVLSGNASRGLPQQITAALRSEGWVNTEVQVPDGGGRFRVWYRGSESLDLLRMLPVAVMRARLEKDRAKTNIPE